MNTMTLDEMKVAVCRRLRKTIWVADNGYCSWTTRGKYDDGHSTRAVFWPTEGLQVCHEAEKLLKDEQPNYVYILECICKVNEESLTCIVDWALLHATYEQRLEALCRVWHPERFSTH